MNVLLFIIFIESEFEFLKMATNQLKIQHRKMSHESHFIS